MKMRTWLVVSSLALAPLAACAAPAATDADLILETRTGKADGAGLPDVILTETDDGATTEVALGQSLVLRLPSNPSTGYGWEVVATDRTFGYPEESFEADSTAIGAGGVAIMRWSTGGPLSMLGSHTVKLSYMRSWEAEAAREFTFTVVVKAAPVADEVVIGSEHNRATLPAFEGQDVVLRLPSNPSTGYAWKILSTDRTFGYPAEQTFEPSTTGAIGSGGTAVMRWKTSGPLSMLGRHTVRLAYARGRRTAARFEFTVDIAPRDVVPSDTVVVTGEDLDGEVRVKVGQKLQVRLLVSAFHRIEWKVTATNRTFGYPAETTEAAPEGMLDGPSTRVFTWDTAASFLPLTGTHRVTFQRTGPDARVEEHTLTVHVAE